MSSGKGPRTSSIVKLNLVDGDPPETTTSKERAGMTIAKSQFSCPKEGGAGLDARLQSQIGHKLKAMFEEVAQAPIPDKFLTLLQKLDGKDDVK